MKLIYAYCFYKYPFLLMYTYKHFQVTCGAELGVLFVDILVKGKFPCDDETIGQLS